MSIEPIGLIALIAGLLCLLFKPIFSMYIFIPATLLGSAAAILLGSGGQIQPPHFLLLFLVIVVISRRNPLLDILKNIRFPLPGFWLACVVIIGLAGAFFSPRIFMGSTQINAVGATEYGTSVMLTPLAPVGGNITQSIYLVSDLICFLIVVSLATTNSGFESISLIIVVHAALNIFFAGLDVVTYYTNTAFLLDFIRNAQYTLHLEEETGGLKRIAGSFSETSVFSYTTLGAFGYSSTLWLSHKWTRVTGVIAIISLFLLILSTSSTAIVSTPIVLCAIYYTAIKNVINNTHIKRSVSFLVGLPLLSVFLTLLILLNNNASETIQNFLNTLIFDKSASQSGLERASWNKAALDNFFDTYMLGAGLGSVRASSFLISVPANIGIVGSVFFLFFFYNIFSNREAEYSSKSDVRAAARNGCIGMLAAAAISGALVDLGLQFYILAGLSCAYPRLCRK